MDQLEFKKLESFFVDALQKNGISVSQLIIGSVINFNVEQSNSGHDLILVSDQFNNVSADERNQLTAAAEIRTQRTMGIPFRCLKLSPDEYQVYIIMQSGIF